MTNHELNEHKGRTERELYDENRRNYDKTC